MTADSERGDGNVPGGGALSDMSSTSMCRGKNPYFS